MKNLSKIWLLALSLGIFTLAWCGSNQTQEVVNQPMNEVISENSTDVILNETQWSEESIENTQDSSSQSSSEWQDTEMDSSAIASEWQENEQPEDEDKIIVVYFSRADENYQVGNVEKWNTKLLAEHMISYLWADSFEIVPVNPYPVDYDETTRIATQEKDENARPEYVWEATNWADYDVVFLGYPIWWWDLPMIVYTFLDNHDFTWKKVYLFNTHEWSGNSWTYKSLKNRLSTADVNTDWLTMRWQDARKDSAKSEVENWLKGLWF